MNILKRGEISWGRVGKRDNWKFYWEALRWAKGFE